MPSPAAAGHAAGMNLAPSGVRNEPPPCPAHALRPLARPTPAPAPAVRMRGLELVVVQNNVHISFTTQCFHIGGQ